MAVLIRNRTGNRFEDKTREISRFNPAGRQIKIVFNNGRPYTYGQDRVRILRKPRRRVLAEGERVEADGSVWDNATEVLTFAHADGSWSRIFYETQTGERYSTRPASGVRVITSAAGAPVASRVLDYWRTVASGISGDNTLGYEYGKIAFVHPESVLSAFLGSSPIESGEQGIAPIFPFRCNLSQRAAVEKALVHSVSVIEGPPGTGKTETILNLIANIVAVRQMTVGIVSFGNAAVDNVRDKLDELGFGHVVANLGRREKRAEFFAEQEARNASVTRFLARTPDRPDPKHLANLDRRLRELQTAERTRAERREALDAHRLELRHFEDHLRQDRLPDLEGLPILRRSADRVLDYLAESELELAGIRPGPLRRIRNYFRYGSVRTLDPADTSVVLRLQQTYYHKRIAELEKEIRKAEDELRKGNFEQLSREHQQLSVQLLHAELAARYRESQRTGYNPDSYRLGKTFSEFIKDYPVVLSTCHSLRNSIANGYLFDYLIIDEASQVNLLQAGLAMSCARRIVVVGDRRQLPPVPVDAADGHTPPEPAFDCNGDLLASLSELYGTDLPRTLLCEHYRCDPVIIGSATRSSMRANSSRTPRAATSRP